MSLNEWEVVFNQLVFHEMGRPMYFQWFIWRMNMVTPKKTSEKLEKWKNIIELNYHLWKVVPFVFVFDYHICDDCTWFLHMIIEFYICIHTCGLDGLTANKKVLFHRQLSANQEVHHHQIEGALRRRLRWLGLAAEGWSSKKKQGVTLSTVPRYTLPLWARSLRHPRSGPPAERPRTWLQTGSLCEWGAGTVELCNQYCIEWYNHDYHIAARQLGGDSSQAAQLV